MEDGDALRRQQRRGRELRHRLRLLDDREYDPDAALLRRFSPSFPRFTGHTVGQQSLEYALLLLHSDDRLYGADDAGEANRIIRAILRHQDRRADSETYGNFYWMTHWDRVKDRNAVSFLCAGLVYAYRAFPHKLHAETKAALEEAFPIALAGIRNHKVRWQYTNIFCLNLGGLVGLAGALGDRSAHDEAARDFDAWLAGTAEDGVHEFNSPTYTPVTLFGLEAAWAATPDPDFRARLERAMALFAYQLALNLVPNGFLGGAPSRAYHGDAVHGASWASVYAHLKFGTPLAGGIDAQQTTMYANLTLFDYVPPAPVRALATRKPAWAETHDRVRSLGSRRTHLMTPRYSLSSQSMERVGGHAPPAYALLVRNERGPRISVPFLPDESFTHQPCPAFQARQVGGRIVGRLRYAPTPEERAKCLADHTYIAEPHALLGPRESVREARIGNVDWAGGEVRLLPGQALAVSYGTLYLGVVALPLDRRNRPQPGRLTLAYGDDGELRLRLRLFGGPDLREADEPADVLLLIDVTEPAAPLADYAAWLAGWRLRQEATDGASAFAAEHADGARLRYPPAAEAPDPLGDALHRSPGLTLAPGDLVRLVNGETPLPFLGQAP